MPKVSLVQMPCRTAAFAPVKPGQSDAQLKPFPQKVTQPVFQPRNAQTVSIQKGSLTTESSISTAAAHVRAQRFGGTSLITQLLVTGLLFSARAVGAQPQPNDYCHDQLGHGQCRIAPINQDQLLAAFLNEPQRMNQTDVERFCKSVGFTANDLQQSIRQLSCRDNYLETVKPCMNELLNITQTCSGATGDTSDDDSFSPSPSNEPQFNQLSYWFLLAAPLLGLYRNIDQFYKATSFSDITLTSDNENPININDARDVLDKVVKRLSQSTTSKNGRCLLTGLNFAALVGSVVVAFLLQRDARRTLDPTNKNLLIFTTLASNLVWDFIPKNTDVFPHQLSRFYVLNQLTKFESATTISKKGFFDIADNLTKQLKRTKDTCFVCSSKQTFFRVMPIKEVLESLIVLFVLETIEEVPELLLLMPFLVKLMGHAMLKGVDACNQKQVLFAKGVKDA